MKNLIDNSKFTVINEIALQQTCYLRKYYSYVRSSGEKEEVSCFYLKRLIPERDEELLGLIATVFAELGRIQLSDQNVVQEIGEKRVHISQFIWGRMCVLAYFFFHDEPAWQNLLFRKMDERISVPELITDIQTAKNLIDEYYQEKDLLATGKNRATALVMAELEDVISWVYRQTGDYQRVIEFLQAEKTECSDGDWARYALAIYRHKKVFQTRPSTFKSWLPIFCKAFGREVNYQEPNKLERTPCKKDIEPYLP